MLVKNLFFCVLLVFGSLFARTVTDVCTELVDDDSAIADVSDPMVNCVYVKPEGDKHYKLVHEPSDPDGIRALKAAYVTSGFKEGRRLMPRQLTGFLSQAYGFTKKLSGSNKQVDDFMSKFHYQWYPGPRQWEVGTFGSAGLSWGPTMKAFAIDPEDWEIQYGFSSFNDFFIKKLKPEARPIAAPEDQKVVISPADAKLTVIPNVRARGDGATFFNVKDEKFTLEKFLNDRDLARDYDGGTLMIFRLSPYNYHRFHFPIDAVINLSASISGGYESVDPITYKTGINPLMTNKRRWVLLESNHKTSMLMVIVGAFNVGSIQTTYTPGQFYHKGAELGYFQYGGSTIVLLFKRGAIDIEQEPIQTFIGHSAQGYETAIKMGEKVARLEGVL